MTKTPRLYRVVVDFDGLESGIVVTAESKKQARRSVGGRIVRVESVSKKDDSP